MSLTIGHRSIAQFQFFLTQITKMIPRSPLLSMLLLNWCIQVPLPGYPGGTVMGDPGPVCRLQKDHTLVPESNWQVGSRPNFSWRVMLVTLAGHVGHVGHFGGSCCAPQAYFRRLRSVILTCPASNSIIMKVIDIA